MWDSAPSDSGSPPWAAEGSIQWPSHGTKSDALKPLSFKKYYCIFSESYLKHEALPSQSHGNCLQYFIWNRCVLQKIFSFLSLLEGPFFLSSWKSFVFFFWGGGAHKIGGKDVSRLPKYIYHCCEMSGNGISQWCDVHPNINVMVCLFHKLSTILVASETLCLTDKNSWNLGGWLFPIVWLGMRCSIGKILKRLSVGSSEYFVTKSFKSVKM